VTVRCMAMVALTTLRLLAADEPPRPDANLIHTERMDFSAGGVLHLKDSTGELSIGAWDRPDMELTTIRSTDKVRITSERRGDEVLVTTILPHRSRLVPRWPWTNTTGIEVEYRIHVPRDARLVVEREVGEVHVAEVAGDIRASVRSGAITLRLPGAGSYAIDAKSRIGAVVSDLDGSAEPGPWPFGHRFSHPGSAGARKLYLRAGFGDIVILKVRKPDSGL
jgi:hypothetical protein